MTATFSTLRSATVPPAGDAPTGSAAAAILRGRRCANDWPDRDETWPRAPRRTAAAPLVSAWNQQTYQRLKLSLRLELRRQIFVAVCDDLAARDRLATLLAADLAGGARDGAIASGRLSLVTLHLDPDDPDPLGAIQRWQARRPPAERTYPLPQFQLLGVERLTRQAPRVQRAFLEALEGMEASLPGLESSLLLWMSRPWFHAIRQSAVEFWRWRTGIFEFEGEPTPPEAALQVEGSPPPVRLDPTAWGAPAGAAPGRESPTETLREPPQALPAVGGTATIGESRAGESRAGESRAGESRAGESGLGDSGVGDSGVGDLGAKKFPVGEAIAANPSSDPAAIERSAIEIVGQIAGQAAAEARRDARADLDPNLNPNLDPDLDPNLDPDFAGDLAPDAEAPARTRTPHRNFPAGKLRERAPALLPEGNRADRAEDGHLEAMLATLTGGTAAGGTAVEGKRAPAGAAPPVPPPPPPSPQQRCLGAVARWRDRLNREALSLEDLASAIAAARRALDWLAPEDPSYPDVLVLLGDASWLKGRSLADAPDRAREALRQSLQAYDRALTALGGPHHRRARGLLHHNQGAVYSDLARYGSPADCLQQSVRAYRTALDCRTGELTSGEPEVMRWHASTWNNLGTLHWTLSRYREPVEQLRRAIAAYRQALSFYRLPSEAAAADRERPQPPAALPANARLDPDADYGMFQANLGTACLSLGQRDGAETWLHRAVRAYQLALPYRPVAEAPAAHAATQNNLGTAYWYLARRLYPLDPYARRDCWERAIAAYDRALAADAPEAGFDRAAARNQRALLQYQLALDPYAPQEPERCRHRLQQALDDHLQALDAWQQDAAKTELALKGVVQVVRALYRHGGLAEQNDAFSRIPSRWLAEVMGQL